MYVRRDIGLTTSLMYVREISKLRWVNISPYQQWWYTPLVEMTVTNLQQKYYRKHIEGRKMKNNVSFDKRWNTYGVLYIYTSQDLIAVVRSK